MESATLIASDRKLSREELALVPTPLGTLTHRPVPHHELVDALIETLGFRHIAVHKDEYAVSRDGMKMFGIMELETVHNGVRFAIGLRNSHDKSMRLALTVGYKVCICENGMFHGDFTPLFAKHTKNFQLLPALAYGVDQIQRNFAPMVQAIELWKGAQISDVDARMVIYRAFIESEVDVPKHLARVTHDLYFNPQYEEFAPRTKWSLQNAFTSAFKQLDPIPAYKATASLADFFQRV